jgi:hypothetical protein
MAGITRNRAVAVTGLGVATVVGVGAFASPAGASTQGSTHEFDFVTSSGDPVTCTIRTTRTWGGSDGTSTLRGSTEVIGGPEACYNATAYIGAAYTDPSGQHVRSEDTGGTGGSVSQTYATAASENPRTYHRVQFNDCGYYDPGLCSTPVYSHVGCGA